MRAILLFLSLLFLAGAAAGADGYTLQNSQNIMHFVGIDEDRAKDIATYRRAIGEICQPDTKCQVLFWVGQAPNGLPITREQERSKVAYWQYSKKTGAHHLYVDCDFFGEVDDAECF
jgi:hypothetical protein